MAARWLTVGHDARHTESCSGAVRQVSDVLTQALKSPLPLCIANKNELIRLVWLNISLEKHGVNPICVHCEPCCSTLQVESAARHTCGRLRLEIVAKGVVRWGTTLFAKAASKSHLVGSRWYGLCFFQRCLGPDAHEFWWELSSHIKFHYIFHRFLRSS